jgi:hypothetical protein
LFTAPHKMTLQALSSIEMLRNPEGCYRNTPSSQSAPKSSECTIWS